jgi:glucosamine--fructose-6-phosphate aminotransferase (isomerizing)
MSLSYSEAFHFMEFRHGPMSMINEHSLVIGMNDPRLSQFEFPVLRDMKKLGGRILGIGAYGDVLPPPITSLISKAAFPRCGHSRSIFRSPN